MDFSFLENHHLCFASRNGSNVKVEAAKSNISLNYDRGWMRELFSGTGVIHPQQTENITIAAAETMDIII